MKTTVIYISTTLEKFNWDKAKKTTLTISGGDTIRPIKDASYCLWNDFRITEGEPRERNGALLRVEVNIFQASQNFEISKSFLHLFILKVIFEKNKLDHLNIHMYKENF